MTGDTATYKNALAGVGDLVVKANAVGFTHHVVISERPTSSVEIPVDVVVSAETDADKVKVSYGSDALRAARGADGVGAKTAITEAESLQSDLTFGAGGSLQVTDEDGKALLKAPVPVMWDSSETPSGDPKTARLGTVLGQERQLASKSAKALGDRAMATGRRGAQLPLTLTASDAFLSDPATVYPVTIDPTWEPAYLSYGDTFVQDGTTSSQAASEQLKSGTADGFTARSLISAPVQQITQLGGGRVLSADLTLSNYYSGSCGSPSAKVWAAMVNQSWDPATVNWATKPSYNPDFVAESTVAKGYSSSCPAGDVTWNITQIAQHWAKNPSDILGIMMRSAPEADIDGWRRWRSAEYPFHGQSPRLRIIYDYPNQAPPKPVISCPAGTSLDVSQMPWWTTAPATSGTCTISVTNALGPGNLEVWMGSSYRTVPLTASAPYYYYGGTVQMPMPNGAMSYQMQARATTADGLQTSLTEVRGGWGSMTLTSPAVATSESVALRTSNRVTLSAKGPAYLGIGTGIVYLAWRVKGEQLWTLTPRSELSIPPSAVDGAWPSQLVSGVVDLSTLPTTTRGGTTLDKRLPVVLELGICVEYPSDRQCTMGGDGINVVGTGGFSRVVRLPHAFGDGFPVTGAGPGQVALWTGEYALDATDVDVPASNGSLTLRRSYSTYGGPTSGPGGVMGDEWSVALDGSESGLAGMGVIDHTLLDGTIVLLDPDGSALFFATSSSLARRTAALMPASPGTVTLYPADDDTLESGVVAKLEKQASAAYLMVTEPDGTVTRFSLASGGAAGQVATFRPASVQQPGDASQTTFTYGTAAGTVEFGKVTRILAPVPAITVSGVKTLVDCSVSPLPAGCRALELKYGQNGSGASAGMLTEVNLLVGGSSVPVPLVRYGYSSSATTNQANSGTASNLTSVTKVSDFNPSTGVPTVGTGFTTTFTYEGGATDWAAIDRLASVKAPGLAAYRLTYQSGTDELLAVDRDKADGTSGTTRLSTFVYDVPVNSSVAGWKTDMPNLTQAAVDEWAAVAPVSGETAMPTPTRAVAVFGQGETPASTVGASLTADELKNADVSYTDKRGYEVYTATFGAGAWQFGSAQYDSRDNVVRALDSDDIAQILAVPSGSARMEEATKVGTLTVYNQQVTVPVDATRNPKGIALEAGTLVTDVYEPAREVTLPDGGQARMRPHTHTSYDKHFGPTGVEDTPKVTIGSSSYAVNPDTLLAWGVETGSWTTLAEAGQTPVKDSGNIYSGAPAGEDVLSASTTGYDHAVPLTVAGHTNEVDLDSGGQPVVTNPGWRLGLAATNTTVVDGAGSDLVTHTSYDKQGRVVATTSADAVAASTNPTPASVGTRETIYYTGEATNPRIGGGKCANQPKWAGWVCVVRYAANPPGATGVPDSLITEETTSYNALGQALQVVETSAATTGTATRTTTTTYLQDGRTATSATSVTGLGSSTPVESSTFAYDTETGALSKTTASGGEKIETTSDKWGRQTVYTITPPSSSGDPAESTETVYDTHGRVATVTDDSLGGATPGVTSYYYDAAGQVSGDPEERRDLLTKVTVANPDGPDSGVFTLTGVYDGAGRLTMQRMPGGVDHNFVYDEVGQLTGTSYTGVDMPEGLAWTQSYDGLGRVVGEVLPGQDVGSSSSSVQLYDGSTGPTDEGLTRAYAYDKAGRLIRVVDHVDPTGAGGAACVVRDYTFDEGGVGNGTRTKLRTTGGVSGVCQDPGTGPNVQARSWTYDTADRLIGGKTGITTATPAGVSYGGYVYDLMGRVTTLPAVDTPASRMAGVPLTGPSDVSLGYYDTDAVRSISQTVAEPLGPVQVDTEFTLDAAGRRAKSTTTRAGEQAGGTDPDPDPEPEPTGDVVAADEFDRSVTNGLGTADTGGAWMIDGNATSFKVTGGTGRIIMPWGDSGPAAWLQDVDVDDVEIATSIGLDKRPSSGKYAYVTAESRVSDSTYSKYRASVEIGSSGQVKLYAEAVAYNTGTTLATYAVPGLTYAVGDTLKLRMQTEGTDPTTIRIKVWKSTDTEPTGWQIEVTDDTEVLQESGMLGLSTYLDDGVTNAPISAIIDDFTATTLEAAGTGSGTGGGSGGGSGSSETEDVTTSTTTVRHYTDGSDNPGWVTMSTDPGDGGAVVESTERYVGGLDGSLAATLLSGTDVDGKVQLAISSPHGDVVGQITLDEDGGVDESVADQLLSSLRFTDEYGNALSSSTVTGTTPLNSGGLTAAANGGLGYGWLGAKERATDPSGLVLMGDRVYNSATGQFTSVDPLYGGGTTAYAYPTDPINLFDLDGNGWFKKLAKKVGKVAGKMAAVTSYCPLAQCQAVTLALGAVSAGAYFAAGDKHAAWGAVLSTTVNLTLGGRGKFSSFVRGKNKISSGLRTGLQRVESKGRGGLYGAAWSRAGKSRNPWLGRGIVGSVWWAQNVTYPLTAGSEKSKRG